MAYDEVLAQRIHDLIDGDEGWTSRKMFGGLGFMLDGHMAVAAASNGALMVRADPADCEEWCDGEAVNPMEMRGRPMSGWLLVEAAALADDDQLGQWVGRGVRFVRTLPPKLPSP
jgi:TfoX/Sxy family transcriptional regulator of competence genes